MGARVFSDAARMVGHQSRITGQASSAGRLVSSFNQNFRANVLYDNGASQPFVNLPATEAWLDGTPFYRLGLNIGPTFHNTGKVSATVYAANSPREFAERVKTDASLVTLMTPLWVSLGAVAVGARVVADGGVYSLFRIVFATGDYGSIDILTL